MRDQVRDALASRTGLTAWSERDNGNAAGCADFSESDGYTAFLPSLLLAGGVPDQQWTEAVKMRSAFWQVAPPAGRTESRGTPGDRSAGGVLGGRELTCWVQGIL